MFEFNQRMTTQRNVLRIVNSHKWRGDAGGSHNVVDCLAIVLAVFQRQRLAGSICQSVGVIQTR